MKRALAGALILAVLLAACAVTPAASEIILATTTSTQDAGLLDVLVPEFERQSGYTVKTIAVGTGQALKMGEQGNADVLLVHAPAAERQFMAAGYGLERRLVMHNDYVIVGPPTDPAGVQHSRTAIAACQRIAAVEAAFISRGDDSGTHQVEQGLWAAAGVVPAPPWYQQAGQGMAATLRIASEKGAYTLADRATYLTLRTNLDLRILLEGDPALLNVYHVIVVNPAQRPTINLAGAKAWADYLIAPETQARIGQFGVEKYGQPLFFPDADKTDADLGLP